MLPLVLFMADKGPNSYVRKATFSIILPSPRIQAMLVVAVAACVIPLYLQKVVRRVIYFPQFFCVEDPEDGEIEDTKQSDEKTYEKTNLAMN